MFVDTTPPICVIRLVIGDHLKVHRRPAAVTRERTPLPAAARGFGSALGQRRCGAPPEPLVLLP